MRVKIAAQSHTIVSVRGSAWCGAVRGGAADDVYFVLLRYVEFRNSPVRVAPRRSRGGMKMTMARDDVNFNNVG